MTGEKRETVLKAIAWYRGLINGQGVTEAKEFDLKGFPLILKGVLGHCLFMLDGIEQAIAFRAHHHALLDLTFVQAMLWANGLVNLDAIKHLRDHNEP